MQPDTVGVSIIDVFRNRYPCGPGDSPPPSPCGLTFWNHLYGQEGILEVLRVTLARTVLLLPGFLLFKSKIGWKGVAIGACVSALTLTTAIYLYMWLQKGRCVPPEEMQA